MTVHTQTHDQTRTGQMIQFTLGLELISSGKTVFFLLLFLWLSIYKPPESSQLSFFYPTNHWLVEGTSNQIFQQTSIICVDMLHKCGITLVPSVLSIL